MIAFSWGYAGWGPYTAELVSLFDQVEAARGFAPPVFVDIRLRRAVRAPGFRDRAFEQRMGPQRYVWMPELGNLAIANRALPMTIAKPAAAADLLARIERTRARVIFFCSCESPVRRRGCHRGLVTMLLVAAARERGIPLTVQEWPGGSPERHRVAVPDADFEILERHLRAATDATTTIAIPEAFTLAQAGALAHFTVLECTRGRDRVWAVSGPAIRTAKGWRLPIYRTIARDHADAIDEARSRFVQWKLAPLTALSTAGSSDSSSNTHC